MTKKTQDAPVSGVIAAGAAYSYEALKKRGFSYETLRAMRKNGLKVRKVGKRCFVVGADFLEYLESLPVDAGA